MSTEARILQVFCPVGKCKTNCPYFAILEYLALAKVLTTPLWLSIRVLLSLSSNEADKLLSPTPVWASIADTSPSRPLSPPLGPLPPNFHEYSPRIVVKSFGSQRFGSNYTMSWSLSLSSGQYWCTQKQVSSAFLVTGTVAGAHVRYQILKPMSNTRSEPLVNPNLRITPLVCLPSYKDLFQAVLAALKIEAYKIQDKSCPGPARSEP